MPKPTDALETTTQLVRSGIYRFIRLPLHSSLLTLASGIFFKSPSCWTAVSPPLHRPSFAPPHADDTECLIKFGRNTPSYMTKTRMFIPFVF